MKIFRLKYCIAGLFCALSVLTHAQSLDFQNLTMADGLSGSRVNTIEQDRYGFMWIGTENGLNIYDGIRFRHYFSENDERSLPGNRISDMVFDGDSVWVATRSGLCKMDISTKTCRTFDLGGNLDVRVLFLEENKNILWVGTASGLLRLNTTSGSYREYNTSNGNISHNTIRAIYKDSRQNLWVGTYDKLNVLKPQSEVFKNFNLKTAQQTNLTYNLVLSICPYANTNDTMLWVGTETGLVMFNSITEEMTYFHEENSNLSNSVIKTIHRSETGSLWLGTDFGLGRMEQDFSISTYFHDLNKPTSLANSIVWDIFEDNSGTLWFGTNNGLSILSNTTARFEYFPVSYRHKDNQVGYELRDIIETTDNNFWIASQNGAIYYGRNKQQIKVLNSSQSGSRKLVDDNTTNLLEDRKGNIWIGTNGGLSIWNPNTEKLKTFSADNNSGSGLRSNYILAVYELEDGTLLVNTQKGLHKAIKRNGTMEFEYIRNIGFSSAMGNNFLWAIQYSRLLKIDPRTLETIDDIRFEKDGKYFYFRSLLVSDNTVWLGTDGGLMQYDIVSGSRKYHQLKSNKSFPFISLLEDDNGNIWAASYSAIAKFTRETESFEIYPSGFEIPITRFLEGSSLKTKEGDLIFGGQDGFIRFSPENITKSGFIAPVSFTKLIVSNQEVSPQTQVNGKNILEKEIAFTSEIDLDHYNKSFTVEFSSLHFGSREGIRYAYMLEGEELEWQYINGPVGTANYSNLKPGAYTLKVKGTNTDGEWNPKEVRLTVNILPPRWASPVFIVLYILALLGIIAILIIYFRNRAKFKNELKLARLEKEHTEELSQTRQRFFTNISHEFRTPLSLIIGPTEKLERQKELSPTSKDYVRIIENNARRLLWLNNQLLDFRKLERDRMVLQLSEFELVGFAENIFKLFGDKADRKHITYKFKSGFEQLNVLMDIRKVETILFNLLSNAFKFTPENGEIIVEIESDVNNGNGSGEGVILRVIDSGIGIPEDEQDKIFERFYQADEAVKMERGSGIGLTLVKEYVKMHGGKLELKSRVGKGSTFSVVLRILTETESGKYLVTGSKQEKPLLKPEMHSRLSENKTPLNSGAPLILLVEDDKDISDFIELGFKHKYKVKIAKNGKEALSLVAQKAPDLVISDISMPEMDGIEFTKRFKSNPKTAHIPLILLTGQAQQEKQLEGLRSGADAYMLKPFEIELLEVRIDNYLKRQELLSSFLKVKDITKPKDVQIATQDEKLLEKVVATIEKFISDPDLNIEKVCDDTGFSHSMLYRKIKNLTGQTLNEFIRTIRVQRAEQLLRTKKFNVAEVMHETGFTNHSYFSKAFRKLYKVSPKEYVNNL